MNNNFAIEVANLSKVFTLRQAGVDENGVASSEHWALKDLTFEIKKGESVGIIGPNGSGKSTLLKILAGVTKPTSGSVKIKGKVASILDIGTGFHPDLSGRENVYLNGQIHGFSKKEIESKFDEIVEFSGIRKFIEEPVKNYSNGMYLRLAFSIMAHLDFDVYLFDEVFSVGDAQFSMKTKKKFQELSQTDKTVVFVSHNMSELEGQDTYVLLEYGVLSKKMDNNQILSDYIEKINIEEEKLSDILVGCGEVTEHPDFGSSSEIIVKKVGLHQYGAEEGGELRSDRPIEVTIEYFKRKDIGTIDVFLNLLDYQGGIVFTSSPVINEGYSIETNIGCYELKCVIPEKILSSRVFYVDFVFMKNVQSISNRGDDEFNYDAIVENKKIEAILLLHKISKFKTKFYINDMITDFSDIKLASNLFTGFDWKVSSKVLS